MTSTADTRKEHQADSRTSTSHPGAPKDDTVASVGPTELEHRVSCIDNQTPSDTSTVSNLAVHVRIVRVHLLGHEVLHTRCPVAFTTVSIPPAQRLALPMKQLMRGLHDHR